MSGPSGGAPAALVLLVAVLASDVWVYLDARARAARGTPVVFSVGSFELSAPAAWGISCVLLWILAFPLYLVCRRAE